MKNYLLFLLVLTINMIGCTCFTPLEEAIQKKATAEANVKLALAYLSQGFRTDAQQKLLFARKLDPNNPVIWCGVGFFNEVVGEIAEANDNYQRAIALAPTNGAAHNNYGAFLCRTGQYKQSIEQFQLAVKDPEYLEIAAAYENAGLCALKIPNTTLAKHYFIKALRREPQLVTARRNLDNLLKQNSGLSHL